MNVKNVVPQNSMMMNIINVLNYTFVQLNVSLQNKSINFFQKKVPYWPQTFERQHKL